MILYANLRYCFDYFVARYLLSKSKKPTPRSHFYFPGFSRIAKPKSKEIRGYMRCTFDRWSRKDQSCPFLRSTNKRSETMRIKLWFHDERNVKKCDCSAPETLWCKQNVSRTMVNGRKTFPIIIVIIYLQWESFLKFLDLNKASLVVIF